MNDDRMRPIGEILGRILAQTTARYLTVRPQGLVLPGEPPYPDLSVQILDHGPARTLYQDRHPACRSLDAIRSIDHPQRLCALCDLRPRCTPQIRVHLLFHARPYRLLLAYTSAKNFLLFATEIRHRGQNLLNVVTRIQVLNRGTWGELRFAPASDNDRPPIPTLEEDAR